MQEKESAPREILFKAKRTDNGEWVEGFYREFPIIKSCGKCLDHINHFIDDKNGESHSVNPATLCQYTGLTDKNGVKIFEGDMLQDCTTSERRQMEYHRSAFILVDEKRFFYYAFFTDEYVIIGNIRDKENDNG